MKRGLIRKCILSAATVGLLSAGMIVNAEGSYTVKAGDNLSKIAKEVYGDSSAWKTIYEANKAIIKDPNVIYKGQVFVIPGGAAEAVSAPEVTATPEETQTETPAVAEQSQDETTAVTQQDWLNSLYDAICASRLNGDTETVRAILGNADNVYAQRAGLNGNPVYLEDGKMLDFYFVDFDDNGSYDEMDISANRLDLPVDETGHYWWWTVDVDVAADGTLTIVDAYDSM